MRHIYIVFTILMISSSLNAMNRGSRIELSEKQLIKMSDWKRNIVSNRYIIGNRDHLASLAFKKVRQCSIARMIFSFCFVTGYTYLLINNGTPDPNHGGIVVDLG